MALPSNVVKQPFVSLHVHELRSILDDPRLRKVFVEIVMLAPMTRLLPSVICTSVLSWMLKFVFSSELVTPLGESMAIDFRSEFRTTTVDPVRRGYATLLEAERVSADVPGERLSNVYLVLLLISTKLIPPKTEFMS